jgi:hypothetical protein
MPPATRGGSVWRKGSPMFFAVAFRALLDAGAHHDTETGDNDSANRGAVAQTRARCPCAGVGVQCAGLRTPMGGGRGHRRGALTDF